jgi:hypothetical protein
MMPNDRADTILRAADYLGGGITLQIVYALFPHVERDILRRVVSKMIQRRALAWIWAGELGRKVFLTTRGIDGHQSGVRKCLSDPGMARRALQTGCAGRAVKLPVKFIHNLIAGLVTLGLGGYDAEFERELWRGREETHVADGVAWPEPDRRILVEVERMIGQSPNRWTKKNGLIDRMVESLWIGPSGRNLKEEYLVVAPASLGARHPDVEKELADLIRARAKSLEPTSRAMGWWFLPEEDIESNPRWHSIFAGSNQVWPRPLIGIRERREAGKAEHKERARVDAERKEKKRQQRSAPLPARPRRSTATIIVCTDEQLRELGCLPSPSTDEKPSDPPQDSNPLTCNNVPSEEETVPGEGQREARASVPKEDEVPRHGFPDTRSDRPPRRTDPRRPKCHASLADVQSH